MISAFLNRSTPTESNQRLNLFIASLMLPIRLFFDEILEMR